MTQWKRYREARQQKQKALQLLTLSGALRAPQVEPRYYAFAANMVDPSYAAQRTEQTA